MQFSLNLQRSQERLEEPPQPMTTDSNPKRRYEICMTANDQQPDTHAAALMAFETKILLNSISELSTVSYRAKTFIDLPRELRDQIYSQVVEDDCTIDLYDPGYMEHLMDERFWELPEYVLDVKDYKLRLPRSISSLILTSKRVREEYLEFFLSTRTFTLTPLTMNWNWEETWIYERYPQLVPLWRETFGTLLRHLRFLELLLVVPGDGQSQCSISWRDGKLSMFREEEPGIYYCTCDEERQVNANMAQSGLYDGRFMMDVAARMLEQAVSEPRETNCDCGRVKYMNTWPRGDDGARTRICCSAKAASRASDRVTLYVE